MLKLHDHGILHRDLKASNVLVQLRNPKDDIPTMLNSFRGYGYRNYHLDVADFESSVGVMGTGF
jgi:serine/threonine protein kinase